MRYIKVFDGMTCPMTAWPVNDFAGTDARGVLVTQVIGPPVWMSLEDAKDLRRQLDEAIRTQEGGG